MSDFSFLYELKSNTGECIVTQKITGNKMGAMLDHIAKTVNEHESTYGKGNVSVNMLKARLSENKVIEDKKRIESLNTLIAMATEHYQQKAGKLVVESSYGMVENLKRVLADPKKTKKLVSELKLPDLEKGDTLLVGKFKNRKAEIKDFTTDDKNQPIAQTTKGDQKIFKPRIAKLMPGAEPTEEPVAEKERFPLATCSSCGNKNWLAGKENCPHCTPMTKKRLGQEPYKKPIEETSHGSVAKSVRLNKEKYPEKYCSHPNCLWATRGGSNPCRNHPKAGSGKPKEQ